MKPKLKPAIKVKGHVFTGKTHTKAMKKARAAAFPVPQSSRERIGKFQEPSGKLLSRKQTKKKYGIDHSSQLKKKK